MVLKKQNSFLWKKPTCFFCFASLAPWQHCNDRFKDLDSGFIMLTAGAHGLSIVQHKSASDRYRCSHYEGAEVMGDDFGTWDMGLYTLNSWSDANIASWEMFLAWDPIQVGIALLVHPPVSHFLLRNYV